MNARTIQHPGIEIHEIDMTEYKDTVTTNNAYVIGFTDRGPIYDYSWITTRSEFINLYGEPQNEAEKYLYYAVQSILNNGGTPIVARMPYDNKQCKAYKGLKIKYASYKEDPNTEEGFVIYDWENDAPFPTSGQPCIELEKVGQYINPDGFLTVEDTLINQEVTLINYPSSATSDDIEPIPIPTGSIKNLTYTDLLFNLAPEVGTEFMLDLPGWKYEGSVDGQLWDEVNTAIVAIENINTFIMVDAHPADMKTISAVETTLPSWNTLTTCLNRIKNTIDADTTTPAKYNKNCVKINVDDNDPTVVKEIDYIYDYYMTKRPDIKMTDKLKSSEFNKDDEYVTFFKGHTPLQVLLILSEQLYNLRSTIIDYNSREGIDISTYKKAKDQIKLLRQYINAQGKSHDKSISGVINVLTENPLTKNLFIDLNDYIAGSGTVASTYSLSGILSEYNNSKPVGYISDSYEVPYAINSAWLSESSVSGTYVNNFEEFYISGNTYECVSENISGYEWNKLTIYGANGEISTAEAATAAAGIATNKDKIMKYTGTTTTTEPIYEKDSYYQCVQIPGDTTNYMWEKIEVIESKNILPKASETILQNIYFYTGANVGNFVKDNYYQCKSFKNRLKYSWEQREAIEQKNNMPNAAANYSGVIYQFIGTTTTTYTEDHYYQCVLKTNPANTYEWKDVTVDIVVSEMPTPDNTKLGEVKVYNGNNKYKGEVYNWLNVFDKELGDTILEKDLFFKPLLINGKYPSGLSIPETIIRQLYEEISGTYATSAISTITTTSNENQKQLDKTLAKIYNDPYFKRLDGTLKGQAMVDAHLLTTPEINYKYGVYLDSKECSISNEQYDDLVTTNNFTKADMSVSKYGENIDTANFVIIDKQKTIVDGTGSNEGYFVTIIDPYDGLKNQRLLVNPCEQLTMDTMVSNAVKNTLGYYGDQSAYNWKVMFKNEINTLNTLQRVKNADGIWVGEASQVEGKEQLLDSWSVPLTGNYYDESISKSLMNTFPQIPLTDVASNAASDSPVCMIDKQYSSHIIVAVCKTVVNPSDGKITVSIIEQFFGSLFDEKNIQNGRDLYIGNIINANSNYIEFYRNNYIKPKFGSGYDPEPYNKTAVPQFFIKDSTQLNNACKMVGIDPDIYDIDNIYYDYNEATGKYTRRAECPALIVHSYGDYINALTASNIFIFNKKNTIFYNHHPFAEFTSFSKKESQKIIANTTGLFGQEAGTTANIGDNFIIDMDRCISFIKNVDDIPIYFVADAGLSTIAQFCDNVVWDQEAMKWVTQNFDPDNDPDQEDRYITDYGDVATWRKIVDKLDQISREIRRDCMTIIDAPRQLTLDGAAPKIRRSRPQNSWDDLVGNKLRFISGINSSYCAGYYNWLRTTDDFSGRSFWLPPTCKIIGNYMYLNIVNLPWLAPAGLSYGVINGIHGISHNPSPNEEDQIYLKSWNYIKQYPFDGFIIEGQKTTLTKNSAFNRVNVRTLFLDLERFVYNVARNFKYQVNNSYTREQFVQTIKPKFEDYMIRGGLYDYLIKCDDTNNTPETIDANELRCAIYLKPARLIEFIMIDMIAAKTGANFEEIVL